MSAELILRVIEAARAVTNGSTQNLVPLMDASEALDAALAEPTALWVKGTWADVDSGDRIRVPVAGGGHAEADVLSEATQTWVGSGATQIRVTLSHRPGEPYTMSPSGPVEILRKSNVQPQDCESWTADAVSALREQFPEMKEVES